MPTAISASTWVLLERYADYYMSNTEIAQKITYWFHRIGNVNYPGSVHEAEYPVIDDYITVIDWFFLFRAFGTTHLWPAGIGWGQWNADCDFNGDGVVDIDDLYYCAYNFGRNYVDPPTPRTPPDPKAKTKVRVMPIQQKVTVGTEFSINITIENVEELSLYELKLRWDPTVMKATGVDAGDFFEDPMVFGFFIRGYYLYVGSYVGSTGLPPPGGVNGSGVLCTIHFECTGTATPPMSTIYLSSDLYDINLSSITHSDHEGHVIQRLPKEK
jgi:hypothetical protein